MKRGTPDHPKTLNLADALGLPVYAVCGLLELMWHFTAKFALQGDIGRWTNAEIGKGVRWTGDPDQLIRALIETRWLDESADLRLVVHDWHDHADDATKKALHRKELRFLSANVRRLPDMVPRNPPAVAVAGALPEPEPAPVPPVGDGRLVDQAGEPPPTPATPAEARASALAKLGPPPDETPETREWVQVAWGEFVRLTRSPETRLITSPEYTALRGWRAAGIPLRTVLGAMADVMEKRRGDPPERLTYFGQAVLEANAHRLRNIGGAA